MGIGNWVLGVSPLRTKLNTKWQQYFGRHPETLAGKVFDGRWECIQLGCLRVAERAVTSDWFFPGLTPLARPEEVAHATGSPDDHPAV